MIEVAALDRVPGLEVFVDMTTGLREVLAIVGVALLLFAPAVAASSDPCSAQSVAGRRYVICSFKVADHSFAVHWKDSSGQPYGSLGAFERRGVGAGASLVFAMNGGMYHEDLSPVGYHVEKGQKLNGANTRRAPGNFHMLPNGVFFVEKGRVGVMEARAFLKRNRRPDYATQSGPMLVIDGRLHPIFKADSQSRKIRNGVGVSADGATATFVVSDDPVTFHEFAVLFRDRLGARNALFLDGSISQMTSRSISRLGFAPVGPIVAVTRQVR